MKEKQILVKAVGIQKENWGSQAFFRDN